MRSPALRHFRSNYGLTFRPDASTVLWLPGQDDAYSSTIRDRSGNGNDGTITGATWKNDTPGGIWYLDFDGADDYVTIANHASLDMTDAITMGCWLYPIGGPATFAHMFARGNPAEPTFRYVVSNQTLQVLLANAGGQVAISSASGVFTMNIWQYFAFTWADSDDTVRIYVNGNEVKNGTVTGPLVPVASDMLIGITSDLGNELEGGLALPRLNSTALSVPVLQAHYNQERHLFGV